MIEVRPQRVDAAPLLVVRRRGAPFELASIVPAACGLVWDTLRARGLRGGRHVAVYLNDAIDIEVGVEFDGAWDDAPGEVIRSSTPAGLVATTTWFGPYAGLRHAYAAIREWAAANGHRLAAQRWEVYGHWDPAWDDDPSRIRTDVFWAIAEN